MKTVKISALGLAIMVVLGCTIEAKTTYNPIKLMRKFDKKILRPNMEFYARGSECIAQSVQKAFGVRAAGAVNAGLMVPYNYPTATIITTIVVVAAGVIAYKKFTAKKKIQGVEEDEDETEEVTVK